MKWFKDFFTSIKDKDVEEANEEFKKLFPLHGVPKEKYSEVKDTLKAKEDELAELVNEIEELKNSSNENEETKNKLSELEQKQEEIKQKYEEKLNSIQFNSILDKALMEAGAKDIDIAKATVKFDDLTLSDEGDIKGLEERIKEAKENFSYAYKDSDEGFRGTGGAIGNNPKAGAKKLTRSDIEAIQDPLARQKAIAENIELFQ